jgi:phosphatidylinositol glycan class M
MGTQSKKMVVQPTKASHSSSLVTAFFSRPLPLYLGATVLRVALLLYGLWQDANSPLKYTDIDYLVFTDAARFVSQGASPYARDTYRYTPLLAWMLLPTTWTTGSSSSLSGPVAAAVDVALFSSGKVLFAVSDLVAGWLIERVLIMSRPGIDAGTARKYAAIWLLNPMVATISTRGSSEGLLGVLVMGLLWAALAKRVTLAGLLLGFGVHFKIYPFIYAPAVVWWMDAETMRKGAVGEGKKTAKAKGTATTTAGNEQAARGNSKQGNGGLANLVVDFLTPQRLWLAAVSLGTFVALNVVMFAM